MKLLALVCIVLLYMIIWSVHLKIESGLSSLLVTLINALEIAFVFLKKE